MQFNRNQSIILAIASIFTVGLMYSMPFLPTVSAQSAQQLYDDFQDCLNDAEGTIGYASEQEIRDCFGPLYNTDADADTTNEDKDTEDNGGSDGTGSTFGVIP